MKVKLLTEAQQTLLDTGLLDLSRIPDTDVDSSELQHSPRRRDRFSETDTKRIADLFSRFGRFLFSTIESYSEGFYEDCHLENELRCVEGLADAFEQVMLEHPGKDKKKMVSALYGISIGTDQTTIRKQTQFSVALIETMVHLSSEAVKRRMAAPPNPDMSPNQTRSDPEAN